MRLTGNCWCVPDERSLAVFLPHSPANTFPSSIVTGKGQLVIEVIAIAVFLIGLYQILMIPVA